jgi:hypothetical protein
LLNQVGGRDITAELEAELEEEEEENKKKRIPKEMVDTHSKVSNQ